MADYASEGGHFYTRSGEPFYKIVGANGKARDTTLRDARKLDLVPGVTSVMQIMARPGLEVYKQEQLLLAALTLPRLDGEDEKSWLTRVRTDAKEHAKQAAERGTEIHGALERSKKGQAVAPQFIPWLGAVHQAISEVCGQQDWKAEKSYAHRYGYGCKIDLHSDAWVLDYKGKEAIEDCTLWDEHFMQLAACRLAAGLPRAKCAIVFFGRTEPWAKFVQAEEGELLRGWDMFEACLTLWQARNRIAR